MRPTPDKMRAFMAQLKKKMNLKSLVVTLAAIVVFTTTYLLILPAFTLDKEEAAEQGGIDVVAVETAADAEQTEEVVQPEEPAEPKEGVQSEATAEPKEDTEKAEAANKTEDSAKTEDSGKAEATAKPDVKLLTTEKTLKAEQEKSDDFKVSAVVDENAKVPEDVFLQATELTKDTEGFDYDKYKKDALEALKKDSSDVKGIRNIKFYDISLEAESQDDSVEPEAAVNVRIAYEDGMKVDDAENIRIVHFAEQENGEVKTEVLDAKENNVEAKVDEKESVLTEASFDTEGFSVFAVAESETETISARYITGNGDTYSITVNFGPEANIPADSTLEVNEIRENSDRYEELYEQAETAAIKDKETAVSAMRIFDITIKNGEEIVEPDAPVSISISYDDPMDLTETTEVKAVHFAESGKIEVIDADANSKGTEVTYEQGSFSPVAIVAIDHDYQPGEVSGHKFTAFRSGSQGSILTGSINDANEWQIVDKEYAGNSSAYKEVTSSDGKVRVQKNVIPTAVENEFMVYLGVDAMTEQILTTESITEMIDIGSNLYYAGHGNPYPPVNESTPEENNDPQDPTKSTHCGQLAPGTQGSAIPCSTATGEGFRLNIWYQGKLIANPYLQTAVPNGVLYMKVGNEYIIICNYKNGNDYDTGRPMPRNSAGEKEANCYLTEMSYNALFNHIVNPSTTESTSVIIGDDDNPVTITDKMGDKIVFDGLAYTNSDVSGNYPAASNAGTTVSWTLDPKTDAITSEHITEQPTTSTVYTYKRADGSTYTTTTPVEGLEPIKTVETTVVRTTWWSYNVAEIVYKAHLDVTASGFESGDDYVVNGPTALAYIGGSVTFPVPEVQGTLYDFDFTKVDGDGNPISGTKHPATFTLTGPTGNPDVASTYVNKTVQTDADGKISIKDLPWGTYTLTETAAPEGYSLPSTHEWPLNIGYTSWREKITHKDNANDIYAYENDWKIVNTKNKVTITKNVVLQGDVSEDDVKHTLYMTLRKEGSAPYEFFTDEDGNIVKVPLEINAADSLTYTAEFEGVPYGSYTGWEVDETGASIQQNSVVITTASGAEIQLNMASTTLEWNEDKTEATGTVTNTYSLHGEPRNINFYKTWALNNGTRVPAPDGAWVEYQLYSKRENGSTYTKIGEPVRLTADNEVATDPLSWVVTFENMPTVDSDGYKLKYYVQEVGSSESDFIAYASSTATAPMRTDEYEGENGIIWNKRQSTDVVVKKVVTGTAEDLSKEFSFTAELPEGTPFPAQEEGISVSENTATFKLKNEDTVTLKDVPIGLDLVITEDLNDTDKAIYTTAASGRAEGTFDSDNRTYSFKVAQEDGIVLFTNTRNTGVLRVTKKVTGDEPYQLTDREFKFNVTGPGYPNGTTVSVKVRKSGDIWTGYIDLPNLYVGEYTVSEDTATAAFAGYTWTMVPENNSVSATVTTENTATNPASAVITNNYEQITQDVVFYKQWKDFGDKAGYRYTKDQLARVLNLDNGVEGASVPQGITPAITGDGDKWTITYAGLPTYANGKEASYSLTENSVAHYSTTYENTGSEETAKALPDGTIVNTLLRYELELLKIDEKTKEPIDVAQFKLLRASDEVSTPVVYTIDKENGIYSTSEGKIEFNLPDGYYTLTEIKAPDGYIIASGDYTFSIVNGEIAGDQISTVDNKCIITIPNTPGEELPATGGIGTTIFYILGSLLVVGCGIMLISRRRTDAKK